VPEAAPEEAWAAPVLLTVVVFFMVTIAALLEPAPIEPPVVTLPPELLVTVTFEVLPVALALPLLPLPVFDALFEEDVVLLAAVPDPALEVPCAPPAALVDGEDAVDEVLPVCPAPDPEPLAAPA